MARRKQTRGKCSFCSRDYTKGGMSKHLQTCPQRLAAIEETGEVTARKEETYHLLVEGAGRYWMHLEMGAFATLGELDHYLRAIWLECCGHLSHFAIGKGWGGVELGMNNPAGKVFSPGSALTHLYDYGTTSETMVKVVNVRKGGPLSRFPVYLMARNDPPEDVCMECGEPAAWFCIECMYENDETGLLCDQHEDKHPHRDNYGEPMPMINSPRSGVCGYDGPANPPY